MNLARRFCIILISVLAFMPVFGESAAAPVSPTSGIEDQIIEDIKITGNTTVEEKEVLDTVSFGVGMAFSKYKTREDIKNLYKTGKFDQVNVSLEQMDGKTTLVYDLKEKPRIGKIVISGNKDVSEGDIKGKLDDDEKKIKVKELEYFDEYMLKEGISEIEKLYKEKNFYDAKINYMIKPYKDEHKRGELVEIDIDVDEGGKLKIKAINAVGNKVFSVDKIKGLMDTKEEGWFQSGVLDDAKFIEDLKKILKAYNQEGYVKAKIGDYSEGEIDINKGAILKDYVKFDRENNSITINIPITEGIKYTIKNITIDGSQVFTGSELLGRLDSKPGKVFDRGMFDNDLNTVRSMYAGKGYIFAQVKDTYVYDDDIGTVDITLAISEGTVAYINQIKDTRELRDQG